MTYFLDLDFTDNEKFTGRRIKWEIHLLRGKWLDAFAGSALVPVSSFEVSGRLGAEEFDFAIRCQLHINYLQRTMNN